MGGIGDSWRSGASADRLSVRVHVFHRQRVVACVARSRKHWMRMIIDGLDFGDFGRDHGIDLESARLAKRSQRQQQGSSFTSLESQAPVTSWARNRVQDHVEWCHRSMLDFAQNKRTGRFAELLEPRAQPGFR